MLHLNIEALTILSTLFVRDYEQKRDAANQYLFKSGLYRRRQRCHLFSHEILCERLYRRAGPRIERKRPNYRQKF